MSYACPKCKGTDLRVEVTTVMTLLQDSDGNIQTIDDDARSDHEWDGESTMLCNGCDWTGRAEAFDTEPNFESLAAMIPSGEHWTPLIIVDDLRRDGASWAWRDRNCADGWSKEYPTEAEAWKAACIAHDMLPQEAA